MEAFAAKRKASLAMYKLQYEMNHGVVEDNNSEAEDEID